MSLFAALNLAVGGLNAQSTAIGNVSDNISNANTIGYKRVDTSFQSMVTESSASSHSPGGVLASPVFRNDEQGNLIDSRSPTSLAVSGKGFFAVKRPITATVGETTFSDVEYFTRRGDFKINNEGYLVNDAGYYLSGYAVNQLTQQVDITNVVPIQINAALDAPIATSRIDYNANLPASAQVGDVFSGSRIQIYDHIGNIHEIEFAWEKVAGTNEWTFDINAVDATVPLDRQLTFQFNTGVPSGTLQTITNLGGSGPAITVIPPTAPDNFARISFTLDYPGSGNQTIFVAFGRYDTAAGITQFDADDMSVSKFSQNGIPRGTFQDLSVDESGFLSFNYDSGRTVTQFQIPLASFLNPNKLDREDGDAFRATLGSGNPQYVAAGDSKAGAIVSGSLEMSNVDIAAEFTKMLQMQRAYSANARTITTASAMLEEIINVIR